MGPKSTGLSVEKLPKARLLAYSDEKTLRDCGVDPASLKFLLPKIEHKTLLLREVKVYAANILKQEMLSIGGDVAIHRDVITGKIGQSNCILMGDLRHFKKLIEKLKSQPGLAAIASLIETHVFLKRTSLALNACGRVHKWESLPVIMGIVNITDDSFSDGGLWSDTEAAYVHAMDLIEGGAEIIDIGAESTRPGAKPVDKTTEMSRVIPVIKRLVSSTDIPISIDTQKSEVAKASLDAGACIVNDVSAVRNDEHMLSLVKEKNAAVILMHMRGTPQTMQKNIKYDDIVTEIFDFLEERINTCVNAGIDRSKIIIDPGIGFGKELNGNLTLIKHIAEFKSLGVPVLLGHSRKTFIGNILDTRVDQREEGTDAVTAWATLNNIDIVRVHDAVHAKRVRAMIKAIMDAA